MGSELGWGVSEQPGPAAALGTRGTTTAVTASWLLALPNIIKTTAVDLVLLSFFVFCKGDLKHCKELTKGCHEPKNTTLCLQLCHLQLLSTFLPPAEDRRDDFFPWLLFSFLKHSSGAAPGVLFP